jgi:hypothetical protein
MVQHNKLSRRRFLALGCGAICTAALVGGCASRLGTEGLEADGQTDDAMSVSAQGSSSTRCPKGLVNDPYPGRCHHYVDSNGSGYCDLSESV